MLVGWILGVLSFCASARAECDLPQPIALPIRSVDIGQNVRRRGFEMKVGSPAQGIALAVNLDWNQTVFYPSNGGECPDDITNKQCRFNRGGFFDDTGSDTFIAAADSNAAELRAANGGNNPNLIYGADDVVLTDGSELKNFTFYRPTGGGLPQSGLGLGRESTVLQALYDAGDIASRSWSLFWGLEGKEAKDTMDGSLVMGGYDKAKTTGPNSTQAFSTIADISKCPSSLLVTVTDIVVKYANGVDLSLFGGVQGTAIRTCIKPDIPLITFPGDIFTTFQNAIGGTHVGPSPSFKNYGMNYLADDVFNGDLQFVLSSGLEITVPNHQLVTPSITVDQDGLLEESNNTLREVLVYDSRIPDGDMPLLGQVFLAAAYLHVDNERSEFTLWQANPTTEEDLVIVPSTKDQSCPQSSPGKAESGTSESGTANNDPATSRRGLSTGAMAGIGVGVGLAVIALLTAVLLALRRKRQSKHNLLSDDSKRHSSVHNTQKEMIDGYGSQGPYEGAWGQKQNGLGVQSHEAGGAEVHELLHPDHGPTYELLHSHNAPRYEMDGGNNR